MARFRVRLRFNPGRDGAPLDKLGEFATQSEKFLRSLANDLGVPVQKGELLAREFGNESVSWDTAYAGAVTDAVPVRGLQAISHLTSDQPLSACNLGFIGYNTLAEFSRIGKTMDPDEKFLIGVYRDNGDAAPQPEEMHDVSYQQIAEIRRFLEAPFVSYGAVQGVMHAWFKGAEPAFFNLRELSTGNLIKCIYKPDQYQIVRGATKEEKTVVHVYGDMEWDRATNTLITVHVSEVTPSEPLSEAEFDSIFGSIPEFTASQSTSEYIEWLRGDGD